MAALPPAKDSNLHDRPNALSAYNVCLSLERKATTTNDLMHARLLGYLILHAPSPAALSDVDLAIHSCAEDDDKLSQLGQRMRIRYIAPFKKFRGQTPTPSYHSSCPSFDRFKKMLEIKEAPRNYKEAKAQALIRDDCKCVVTGFYDVASKNDFTVHTELAHIVPQSSHFNVSHTGKKDYSASFLAVLKRFGYDVEKVNGAKVHSLYNVMTMEKNVHDAFDRLELWFESTEIENHYRVRTARGIPIVPQDHTVTFTSPDPVTLPYPSSQLLKLHAAAAKVAHLSGAGEYIDELDRDADDLGVLATDGSSFPVLSHAISRVTLWPVDAVA